MDLASISSHFTRRNKWHHMRLSVRLVQKYHLNDSRTFLSIDSSISCWLTFFCKCLVHNKCPDSGKAAVIVLSSAYSSSVPKTKSFVSVLVGLTRKWLKNTLKLSKSLFSLLSWIKRGPKKIGGYFVETMLTDVWLKHVAATCMLHKLNVLSIPKIDCPEQHKFSMSSIWSSCIQNRPW